MLILYYNNLFSMFFPVIFQSSISFRFFFRIPWIQIALYTRQDYVKKPMLLKEEFAVDFEKCCILGHMSSLVTIMLLIATEILKLVQVFQFTLKMALNIITPISYLFIP